MEELLHKHQLQTQNGNLRKVMMGTKITSAGGVIDDDFIQDLS